MKDSSSTGGITAAENTGLAAQAVDAIEGLSGAG
ncbi:hypothetical protein M2105_001043 [Paenibacillus sp. PastF-1]|nr:hypothetical protein [Paenibacillus sp. PastF-2]MDF9846450.1 hypothetical protein [Paenibacillus sp. PastM-2]MDF9853201.1 hypothetical protein [Paenibacillus sp. PastF-1]MDH6478295.1 hypothetical protein [Paenibacillus sp. PastH-2]MDH6506206.1 hypothetical protein [Paenibacillus sp. PastM-3]